eukprot:COSAG06_NODE_20830_length_779_cov_1.717647_1_plen_142_part_00
MYDVQMWEAARATSAAPSFFPPYVLADGQKCVDGGIMANNPVQRVSQKRDENTKKFRSKAFRGNFETVSALPRQDKDRYCQARLRTLVRGKNDWICLVGNRRQVKIARDEAADIWEGRPVGLLVSLGCGRCVKIQPATICF